MKRGHSRQYDLNQQEVEELLGVCSTLQESVLCKTALFSGLRAGELAHLRASWVTNEGLLKIPAQQKCDCLDCQRREPPGHWQPKTEKGIRTIPIAPRLYPELAEFLQQAPQGFNTTRLGIHHQLKRLLKRAGLGNRFPHALRSTCASMLVEGGMEAPPLAYFMGWSSIAQAQAYVETVRAQKLAIEGARQIFR